MPQSNSTGRRGALNEKLIHIQKQLQAGIQLPALLHLGVLSLILGGFFWLWSW